MTDANTTAADGEMTVRTIDVFDKLGYSGHRLLKRMIAENRASFERYGPLKAQKQVPVKGGGGGRPDESYLLNENQFLHLVILSRTDEQSLEFKQRVTDDLIRMRRTRPDTPPADELFKDILGTLQEKRNG